MKNKYYFAMGSMPAAVVGVVMPLIIIQKGNVGAGVFVFMLFVIFYFLFIHTSITLNERSLTIKAGFRSEIIDYVSINKIHEDKWVRPLQRSDYFSNAHIIRAKNIKDIGIEHYMYSREVAIKISKEIYIRKDAIKKQRKEDRELDDY